MIQPMKARYALPRSSAVRPVSAKFLLFVLLPASSGVLADVGILGVLHEIILVVACVFLYRLVSLRISERRAACEATPPAACEVESELVPVTATCGALHVASGLGPSASLRPVLPKDVLDFNSALSEPATRGDVKEAERLWGAKTGSGIRPDRTSYYMILKACSIAETNEAHRATAWLEHMLASGMQPETTHFNFVIQACANQGMFEDAKAWIACMRMHGCSPSLVSYGMIIHGYAKRGEIEAAEAMHSEMTAAGIVGDCKAYNMIIHAHGKSGDLAKAWGVFLRMRDRGVTPSTLTFNLLISVHGRNDDVKGCFALIRGMRRLGVPADLATFHSATRAVAQSKDVEGAEWFINEMYAVGLQPDVKVFNSVLSCCAASQDSKTADVWMRTLVGTKELKADSRSYAAMLSACAQANDLASARYWLGCMDEDGVEVSLADCPSFMLSFTRLSEFMRVEACYSAMIAEGQELSDSSICGLIVSCTIVGATEQALLWNSRMQNPAAPELSYVALVHASAKRGDLASAETWATRMEAAGIEMKLVSYNSVLNACARSANGIRAWEWLLRMQAAGVEPDVTTYNTTVNALAKSGDLDGAESILSSMRERGVVPDGITFNTLMQVCADMIAPERAERILNQFREGLREGSIATNVRHPNVDCLKTMMKLVVMTFANAGEPTRAAHWLTLSIEEGMILPGCAWKSVIGAFTTEGDSKNAARWKMLMSHAIPLRA